MNEIHQFLIEHPIQFWLSFVMISYLLREGIGFFLKTGAISKKLEDIEKILEKINKKLK